MDDFDPVEIERVRRWGRPDWRRFVRPDWERFVHPAGHEAMRQQFALWDRAFEPPSARRMRAEQALQERAGQIALERKFARLDKSAKRASAHGRPNARRASASLIWRGSAFGLSWLSRPARRPASIRISRAMNWGDGRIPAKGLARKNDRSEMMRLPTVIFRREFLDVVQDDLSTSPTLVAQNDGSEGRPIDLEEERRLGGHAIEAHVGKSPEFSLSQR